MAELDDLLVKTSRTFALSIPLLPEPTRREVTVAYLLFRIADTFEDGCNWTREQRLAALDRFEELLRRPDVEAADRLAADSLAAPPIDHQGYCELLAEIPFVLAAYRGLSPDAHAALREHLVRTVQGMRRFVSDGSEAGSLALGSMEELGRYCYTVAGIVGEMLTELFLLGRPSMAAVAATLRSGSAAFGEGLQLVNILKDSARDSAEGRSYLPGGLPREDVFTRARGDLDDAARYVRALQEGEAPRGVVAFCALPVLLAEATLARVEQSGPGAKLSRPEVFALYAEMERALDAGEAAVPWPPRAQLAPSAS